MDIRRGDEVMVDGEWFPVIGYAFTIKPGGERTGSVFTIKPRGKFEPCLGFRIDVREIEDHRRPDLEAC